MPEPLPCVGQSADGSDDGGMLALGLGFIGVLFIVTGIGGLLSRGDELWFSIAWTAVGVSFIAAAVVQAWKSRRR